MVRIFIDNQPFEADPADNVLEACLSLGFDVPYFCWHPILGSVGACRMCAVKKFRDDADKQGKIVMSCLEPVVDGLRISLTDPQVRQFRAGVIEWLMVNHPHDCPVCDEGGECHLQDMTVMAGHVHRRYRFSKRTFRNQNLGPFINHEMNRCIQCFRCVRYYRDYAGGRDFSDFSARDRVYFGRSNEGALQSEFSGNLVEVCPTGVFTDKTFKAHYARPWDLSTAPSICVHCSLGCNTTPGGLDGRLLRVRNRYNGEVNGYLLCDRGRYGYEFVTSGPRILKSRIGAKDRSPEVGVSDETLLTRLAAMVSAGRRPIGIGSPRASLEANFALRSFVGADNFFSGLSDQETAMTSLALEIIRSGPVPTASLKDAGQSDAVLVLGEDVTNVAPLLALSLRQAVRQKPMRAAAAAQIPLWHDLAVRDLLQEARGPLYILTPHPTKLAEVAREIHLAPDEIARVGFAVGRLISGTTSLLDDLSPETASLAPKIAEDLKASAKPLVVAGTGGGSEMILKAAANVARALRAVPLPARLCFTFPECNTLGLAVLEGRPLGEALDKVRKGETDTAIILENDLYRRAGKKWADEFLGAFRNVIVLDHLENPTTSRATAVLSAAVFAESEGTLVNNEGRAQRFFKVYQPPAEVRESWRWLRDLARSMGKVGAGTWNDFDDLVLDMIASLPTLVEVLNAAPSAAYRVHGQKVPRQTFRASGRTAVRAELGISEPKPSDDADSPLAFSMEGTPEMPNPALIPRPWSPSWNSVQAVNKFQVKVGGALRGGDPGRRLFEPSGAQPGTYEYSPPLPHFPQRDEFFIVPIHHIFGSEELSAQSPSIAELIPVPSLKLHPDDAARLAVKDGQNVEVEIDGEKIAGRAQTDSRLARGVAALSSGLPGLPGIPLPAWGKIRAKDR